MARRIYHYNLGGKNNVAPPAPAAPQDVGQSRAEAFKEMHENFKDSLAAQAERTRAAQAHDEYVRQMQVLQDQERVANDTANFRSVYGLLNEQSPNRKAQIADLFSKFPGAAKNPEVQKQLSEDSARLAKATSTDLSTDDQKFLKAHGPSKGSDYATLQKEAGDPTSPNHITSAITYGKVWDLMKKGVGLPSGTPAGANLQDYVKGIESTFEKLPNGQPNPAYQPPTGAPPPPPPPPSTPGPEAVAGWSNADLTGKVAPIGGVAPAAPAAAPTGTDPRKFLQQLFPKTSQVGVAAPLVADNDRNTLNDMMNQTPETSFAAPKPPPPSPTPKPTPAAAAPEQYYTA